MSLLAASIWVIIPRMNSACASARRRQGKPGSSATDVLRENLARFFEARGNRETAHALSAILEAGNAELDKLECF